MVKCSHLVSYDHFACTRPPRSAHRQTSRALPLRIIIDGVTLYNLGYSLPEAAAKLKSRHGHKISPSTLAAWMTEHRELTTYSRLRPQLRHLFPPTKTIRSTKLYHRQVYSFAYHRPKLTFLRADQQQSGLRSSPISLNAFLTTARTSSFAKAPELRRSRFS